MNRRTGLIVGGVLLVVFLVVASVLNFVVDGLWVHELGFDDVFWTGFWAKLWVRLGAAAVIFAFFFVNLRIAATSFGSIRRRISNIEIHEEIPSRYLTLAALGGAAFLAFLFSAAVSGAWLDVLAYLNQRPFDLVDPLFGRNVGWYVFTLPVYRLVQNLAFLLLIAALVILGIVYVTSGGLEIAENRIRFRDRPLRHLAAHVALLFLVLAWGYHLDLAELVYSARGVVYGASYTDVHAQVLGYRVLIAIALAGFGVTVYDFVRGRYGLTLTALGALVLGMIVFQGLYPGAIQQFEVEPNEIAREEPYIARNIAYTRRAFDLHTVEARPFGIEPGASVESLSEAEETLRNIRLWDWRPLLDTYSQLQKLRLYYTFEDVDVDRYDLGAGPRQVMLSAREMSVEELPANVRTWQNQHLIFTHGYGLVMSPVNEVTPEGLPKFYISDIPPIVPDTLSDRLRVDRPEIYYGERTLDYALVATREQEFDYPRGDENVYTSYEGEGGLPIESWWRRGLFSWYLGTIKFLLTDDITSESRLQLHRQIRRRIRKVAPFLVYDSDPYVVLLNGRLVWVQDAYTASDRYPYSEPLAAFGDRRRLNYVRNSVKVVVDAYDGTVVFYAWDEEDPLLATYRSIFPEMFRPADEMPDGLREHLRFPEDLFTIQAEVLRAYHMEDPRVFYNREDMWNIPNEIYQGQPQRMVPYYVLLQLPDDEELEFQLILPFTPTRRDNMIAVLAAKSDPGNYGRRVLYEFPKDRLIYGPMQVEARIDQDPVISEQITLWSQRGSSVVRGNLMVIPLGRTVLYVEPLFLQAQESQLPELKRVIATYGTRIVMEPTLEDAMMALIERAAGVELERPGAPAEEVPPEAAGEIEPAEAAPVTAPAEVQRLVEEARSAYDRAVAAQRRGDWAGYGEALEELGRILDRLDRREAESP
ncbi:MAG: UPF0182 family protein [Gemmatimonadota bacterium]|nr:UPF0182 family protein [Gemmatimonadota bacterium]